MWWAYDRQLDRVLYVAAYITGAEVLWRMCDANVNWEFGKYSLIALIAVGLSRSRRLRGPAVMLFYFTAEESGLLGAQFYVENPVVPLPQTIANINLDSGNLFGRTRDIVASALNAATSRRFCGRRQRKKT